MLRFVFRSLAKGKKWSDNGNDESPLGKGRRHSKKRASLMLEALERRDNPTVSLVVATSFFDSAVYEFNATDGTLNSTLVAPNSSPLLSGPAGLTVGPDHNLYISSQTNNSIVEINPANDAVTTFIPASVLQSIATANGDAQFAPAGLRFGPDGNLYVTLNGGRNSFTDGAVIRFDIAGGAGGLSYTGTSVTIPTPVIQPSGLTFGANSGDTNNLYVSGLTDTGMGTVVKISNALSTTPPSSPFVIPGSGSVDFPLNFPAGLSWGPDGNFYVVDLGATSNQGNVLEYNSNGTFIKNVTPTTGTNNGNLLFQFPSDILFDGQGHFLTANLGSSSTAPYAGSINQYNLDGTFNTAFPTTGLPSSGFAPSQLALLTPHYVISAPSSTSAGSPFSITVTVQDSNNATLTGYTGTIHFTSTDAGLGSFLPGDYTFTAADNGSHTFTNAVSFVTAADQTITATDTLISTMIGNTQVAVTPLATTHFQITAPSTATIGSPTSFTVTAEDQYDNPTGSGYTGTVHFSSFNFKTSLPADTVLTNGTGTFNATFNVSGIQLITAQDTVIPGILGFSNPITVNATATKFTVSTPANVTAGQAFLITVTAQDAQGNTAADYSGTVQITSSDSRAVLPPNATLVDGVGSFLVTMTTAGSATITATDTITSSITGTSATIVTSPGAAGYFKVSGPASADIGETTPITVTAYDGSGNIAIGYTGAVRFTSSDAGAVLPSNATLTNGTGSFNVTLNTGGTQTVTATDTIASNPSITGTSNIIAVSGLIVTNFQQTPTGFVVTFNKPFIAGDIMEYGAASLVQPVTLVGAANGNINGTLLIDPSFQKITFNATVNTLLLANNFTSAVLPDDTYAVTLVSGSGGSNGFQNMLGGLDGANNGGHANYVTSFTTNYQASKTPVLSIPDFARGPSGATPQVISVPNESGNGIPITLFNATAVTDATFTLTYDPTLLTVTGAGTGDSSGAGSTFTLQSSTANSATFQFHDATPQSGVVVLGDILANVPTGAKSNYKAKELLQLGTVTVNGAVFTGVVADSVHVNAYFGDVNGDGVINSTDTAVETVVASTNPGSTTGFTGFPAYALLDPAVVGDLALTFSVSAGSITILNNFNVGLYSKAQQIPIPPVTGNGPNLIVSLAVSSLSTKDAVSMPVVSGIVDNPSPQSSSSATSVVFAESPTEERATLPDLLPRDLNGKNKLVFKTLQRSIATHRVALIDKLFAELGDDGDW